MRRAAAWVAIGVLASGACSSGKDAHFSAGALDTATKVAPAVDAAALRPFVDELLQRRAAETPVVSVLGLQQGVTHLGSAELLVAKLTALGYAPVREAFDDGNVKGTNIYVDVAGNEPELVLVTGHHDAWFQSGADDNGSALAVLVETARALKGRRLRRTVRILAFDREEEGLLGSGAYLDRHLQDNVRIALNLDCVGYASHDSGSQGAPPGFALRDRGDFIAVIANEPAHTEATRLIHLSVQLPQPVDVVGLLTPDNSRYPGVGAFMRSDHSGMWSRGIPALFITDTAEFRNHNYHTPDDTPEKLDYDFLNRVAQLVAASAAAFAETE